jgi:GT2 family glycosyltransferase
MMDNIVFLCSTFNRAEKTLRSLQALSAQAQELGLLHRFVVVDNGSSDQTPERIVQLIPAAKIIQPTVNVFWAGAMRLGFSHLIGVDFDYLVVFNDDIELFEDALKLAISDYTEAINVYGKCCLVGSFREQSGAHSYGGFIYRSGCIRCHSRPVFPSGKVQIVDTLNMNFAVIPRDFLFDVGFLADYFTHRGADTEWGLRVSKTGRTLVGSSQYYGICSRNPITGTSRDPDLNFMLRCKRLFGPKEFPLHERYRFVRTFGPRFWILEFLAPYLGHIRLLLKEILR